MWYASSSAPSGTVSPRWIIRRIACTSGVKNSCALGLNSSLAHLEDNLAHQAGIVTALHTVMTLQFSAVV